MFTVVVLSEYAKTRLERWRDLFEPFEGREGLAFCTWFQGAEAKTLAQAVPALSNAIKGKGEWRVIVVGTGCEGMGPEFEGTSTNPFDFEASLRSSGREVDSSVVFLDAEIPAVRLTHMLLGYPELVPRFQEDPSFWDPDKGRRIYFSETMTAEQKADPESRQRGVVDFTVRSGRLHDFQVHYPKVPHTPTEIALHAEMSARYTLHQARPTEVILVATRAAPVDDAAGDIRLAWDNDESRIPSQFVERNTYPASCRFAVHDSHSEEHSDYELGEMKFWLAVLCLCASDMPASTFQPEALYRIGVDHDPQVLADTLNEHLKSLMSLTDYISGRTQEVAIASPDGIAEILKGLDAKASAVQVDGDGLKASTSGYQLATDSPRSEAQLWRGSVNELDLGAEKYARQPRRALARLVADARTRARRAPELSKHVAPIELAELEEDLLTRTESLVQKADPRVIDLEAFGQMLGNHDAEISRAISERMRRRTIWIALGIALAVWLGAFLPYLIELGRRGAVNEMEGVLVAISTLGVVGGTGLVVLMIMRRRLLRKIRALNAETQAFVTQVNTNLKQIATHLSDLVTYCWRRSAVSSERKWAQDLGEEALYLDRLRRRINARIQLEKDIIHSVGKHVRVDRDAAKTYEYSTRDVASLREEFQWPIGKGTCALNLTGERMSAPYDFITRFYLVNTHVREPQQVVTAPAALSNESP
jgi:hypothetical protein